MRTNAVFSLEDGEYTLDYEDADGNAVQQIGGGVSFENDGSTKELREEEIIEHIDMPDVVYENDGTVWVLYHNHKMNITDQFDDGYCFVTINDSNQKLYLTIKYQDGYGFNSHKYISKKELQ